MDELYKKRHKPRVRMTRKRHMPGGCVGDRRISALVLRGVCLFTYLFQAPTILPKKAVWMPDEPSHAKSPKSVVLRKGHNRFGVIDIKSRIRVQLHTRMDSIGDAEI